MRFPIAPFAAPLVLALVLVAVPRAHAAPGLNLRWNACFGDGGALNRNFACNTNLGGNEVLAESFVLAAPLNNVEGVVSHFEITTAGGTLPAWWQYHNPGTCRQNSLFAGASVPPLAVACVDWSGGLATNAVDTYTIGAFGPSTASLQVESVVAAGNLANLSAGQEYGAITLGINHAKTVGSGSCAGCSTAACIYLRSAEIRDNVSPTPVVTLTVAANGTDSNIATWQGGGGVPALPGGVCAGPVPAHNATWGAVKSLYH